MDLTQFKIKYIPALFSSYDFEDRIYVYARNIEDNNVSIEMIKTDEKFATVDNENYTHKVPIQSLFYTTYELHFEFKESVNLSLLQLGQQLEMISTDNNVYSVEFVDLQNSKIEGTTTSSYILHVRVIQDDDNAVNSYLESNYVLDTTNDNYAKIKIINNNDDSDVSIYTKLIPKRNIIEETIETVTLQNGVEIPITTQIYDSFSLRFYLNEDDKNEFLKAKNYIDEFSSENAFNNQLLNYNGLTYSNEKPMTVTVDGSGLVGIYQVDVIFYVNYYNHNLFTRTTF